MDALQRGASTSILSQVVLNTLFTFMGRRSGGMSGSCWRAFSASMRLFQRCASSRFLPDMVVMLLLYDLEAFLVHSILHLYTPSKL
jgi:hypothetical protein